MLVEEHNKHASIKTRDIARTRILTARTRYSWLANANLNDLFESDEYQIVIKESLPGQSKESFDLEKEIHRQYQHWGNFLCDYESYKVLKRSKETTSVNIPIALPSNEKSYHAELLDEVRDDHHLYLTPFSDQALLLSDAVLLTNLCTLVKVQKWFEILFDLDRSNQGRHFTMFFKHDSYRYLVSTACVQATCNKDEWLYFSSYFCNENWEWDNYNQALEALETSEDINLDREKANFDQIILKKLPYNFPACEVIRLTISGERKQRLYLLYTSLQKLSNLLRTRFRFAFSITDNEEMLRYYNSSPILSYTNISKLKVVDSIICKGILHLDEISQDLEDTTFREFTRRALRGRKGLK